MSVAVDDSSSSANTISNDITDLKWEMPSDTQDVTGLDKSAHEKLLLLADFSITLNGVFNDASGKSFVTFKNYRTLSGSEMGRLTVVAHSGQTLSNTVLYDHFDFSRPNSGELTWEAGGSLADGTVPAWT